MDTMDIIATTVATWRQVSDDFTSEMHDEAVIAVIQYYHSRSGIKRNIFILFILLNKWESVTFLFYNKFILPFKKVENATI